MQCQMSRKDREEIINEVSRRSRIRSVFFRSTVTRVIEVVTAKCNDYLEEGDEFRLACLTVEHWSREQLRKEYGFIWWVALLEVLLPIVIELVVEWWLNRQP